MRRWLGGGLALAVLWVFVGGTTLAPRPLAAALVTGLAFGMPLAFAFRRFYEPDVDLARIIKVLPYAGWYVVLFLYELVTANVDVAYRVLHPRLPIEPNVIEIPLRVETDMAITTIANSITLTPGTLTMDYDEEKNALYVHVMFVPDRAPVVAPIRRWEDLALVIFDEPLGPDAPIPGGEGRDD